jgi:hypothetical protein
MVSPPRIRRVTRRTTPNGVARRLFNNNNSNNSNTAARQLFANNSTNINTPSGIRNNPHFVSMENTPERNVNAYTPRSRARHNERVKRRAVIRRERYEAEEAERQKVIENVERRRFLALLRKGTPTKSEQRESRKRPRSPNNSSNRNNYN